jgi:hypothetical protein
MERHQHAQGDDQSQRIQQNVNHVDETLDSLDGSPSRPALAARETKGADDKRSARPCGSLQRD